MMYFLLPSQFESMNRERAVSCGLYTIECGIDPDDKDLNKEYEKLLAHYSNLMTVANYLWIFLITLGFAEMVYSIIYSTTQSHESFYLLSDWLFVKGVITQMVARESIPLYYIYPPMDLESHLMDRRLYTIKKSNYAFEWCQIQLIWLIIGCIILHGKRPHAMSDKINILVTWCSLLIGSISLCIICKILTDNYPKKNM